MRIHGWCELCRKFKRVTVRSWGTRGQSYQAIGICVDCEDQRKKGQGR